MLRRLCFIIALLALSLPTAVRAVEENAEKLPANLGLYVSLNSFSGLLTKLDAAVVEATADTANAFPEGKVLGLLTEFPLPTEAWDADGEVRMYLSRDYRNLAIIVQAGDFDEFQDKLRAADAEVEETETDLGVSVIEIGTPRSGKDLMAADLGDGRVAVSDNEENLRNLIFDPNVRSWKPVEVGDDDVLMIWDLSHELRENLDIDRVLADFDDNIGEAMDELVDAGLKERVVAALADSTRHGLEKVMEEILKLDALVVRGTLVDNKVRLAVSCNAKPDSYFAKLGKFWTGDRRASSDLEGKISDGALYLAVTLPPAAMIPGSPDSVAEIIESVMADAFPDLKDAMTTHFRNQIALLPNPMVTARYSRGLGMYDLQITRSRDAQACMEETIKQCEVLNAMLDDAIENKEYRGSMTIERLSDGGLEYVRVQPELEDPELAESLLELLRKANPLGAPANDVGDFFRLYLASKGDLLLILSGSALKDDDLPRLAAMLDDSDSILAGAHYREALDRLVNAQTMASVLSVDEVFLFFVRQMAASQNPGNDPQLAGAFARAEQRLPKSGEAIGIGLGSENGRVNWEINLTAKSVNALLGRFDAYTQAVIAEIIGGMEPEDEEEDEEVESEEPAEAS